MLQDSTSNTIRYCPACAVDYTFCNGFVPSDPNTHRHQPIVMRTYCSNAPADFWRDIANNRDNDSKCDICDDRFSSRVDLHACCASCRRYNFCGDCLIASKADFIQHRCAESQHPAVWDYFVFQGVNQEYYHEQMSLAEEERRRLSRERLLNLPQKNYNSISERGGATRPGLRRRTTSNGSSSPEAEEPQYELSLPVQTPFPSTGYATCASRSSSGEGAWFGASAIDSVAAIMPVNAVGDLYSRWGWG